MQNLYLITLLALLVILSSGCEQQYNHDRPNTPANQSGFEKHFGFPPPDDVSNLYYYVDAFGADVTYQLGFTANPEVVKQIEQKLLLTKTTSQWVPTGRKFDWWVPGEIEILPVHWNKNDEGDYFRYLWYSENTKQVYYLEYSL